VIVGDYDILSIDARTGAPRWRFKPSFGYGPGLYLGAVAGGLVFCGSPAGRVYALRAATGALAWSAAVELDGRTTVFAPVVVGGGSGAIVVAGFTTFSAPTRGGLAAFDAETGRERWRLAFRQPVRSGIGAGLTGGPVAVGDLIVAAGRDGRIRAFEAWTGRSVWAIPSRDDEAGVLPARGGHDFRALARAGRALIAGSLTGAVAAYDGGTGTEIWRAAPSEASTGFTMTADEQLAFIPYYSGEIVALGVIDGRERWRIGRAGLSFTAAPLIAGDRVLAASGDGGFVALQR
jgi:outer membrane protein assembly factor BamB